MVTFSDKVWAGYLEDQSITWVDRCSDMFLSVPRNDAKTVNVITTACFSPISKVRGGALITRGRGGPSSQEGGGGEGPFK